MILLSSVSHSLKLIKPKVGSLEPPVYSQLIRDNSDLQLAPEIESGRGRDGEGSLVIGLSP